MAVVNPNRSYQDLKDRAARARQPYEKDWWLNVAFYLGEQYTEWAPDALTIRRIERKGPLRNAPRPVVNKIMHFVNTSTRSRSSRSRRSTSCRRPTTR
jgi:hypothetical protein